MKPLTIGQVASRSGVGVETVRFYERERLISRPGRRPSGYREYGPETVAQIRFIRRAKELGFTLKEIAELLSLRLEPATACADVRSRAAAKIEDIERKIAALRRMRRAVVRLAQRCNRRGSSGKCPFLVALEYEQEPHLRS